MSDTPKNADECKKLLDNGWEIRLYRNRMGSYSAEAFPHKPGIQNIVETDDFEPSQALYRITEKVLGNVVCGRD